MSLLFVNIGLLEVDKEHQCYVFDIVYESVLSLSNSLNFSP
jgi:hypothetical protein